MRRLLALTILLLRVTEGNGETCRFGSNCRYHCNCAGTCDPQTGCDGNCTRGWDGPTCQRRNVALDQRTSQSSNWSSQYTAELAVDGKVGHTLETTPCTHTKFGSGNWWVVILNRTYSIYGFQIYNSKGNCNPNVACGSRLNGFTLNVWNNNHQGYSRTTCYRDTTTSAYGPGDIINGRCNDSDPRIGKVVQINLPSSSPYRPLTLCEVLLFVCSAGWYGEMCDKECVTTTNCTQCDDSGLRCLGCVTGRWGTDCDLDCGHCWNNTACDKNTADCQHLSPRCEAGYEGNNCTTPCTGGRYGPDCLERCGNCTQGQDSCNPASGHCPRDPNKPTCLPGYTGTNCKTQCPDGTYGVLCQESCGECKDGNNTCDRVSGTCTSCAVGWQGERCEEEIKVAVSQPVVGVIVGCAVGVILTSVLITTVILCVRRRQPGGSVGAAVSAENTGVTKDVPHPEPSNRTQGQDTDPVTYYNMASEEHPYETVPEKEYDKMRFSRLDIDTDSNYTSLT